MLKHSGLNLELAWHFCLAYKLDAQLAVLAYVEYMLVQGDDAGYQSKILSALRKYPCPPETVAGLLSAVLTRVSPTDYDRIQFVYSMLQANGAQDDQGVLQRNLLAIDVLRQFDPIPNATADSQGVPPVLNIMKVSNGWHLSILLFFVVQKRGVWMTGWLSDLVSLSMTSLLHPGRSSCLRLEPD